MPTIRVAAAALALSLAVAAPLAAQPAPDPKLEAARLVFDGLDEAERKAIQDALVWTGDYNGTVNGIFGKRSYDGLVAFETRARLTPDGVLDARERAALEAAGAKAKQAVRFTLAQDPRSGVRIGVPMRLLDRSAPTKLGTRHGTADGTIRLDAIAYPAEVSDLSTLFATLVSEQSSAGKVTYKVLRPDFFVISGDIKGERSFTRIARAPDGGNAKGLRGFSLAYPIARAAELDRIAIAVANSFEPFPGQVPAPSPRPPASPAEVRPGPALVASGLVVAPGKVLTVAAVETCAEPLIGGQKARLVRADKAAGLALLDVPATVKAAAAPFAAGPRPSPAPAPTPGRDPLVVVGYVALGPAPTLAVAPGEAVAAGERPRVLAALQRGSGGSAILDRTGALAGLVAGGGPERRLVAGIVPQASHAMVAPAAIAAFLREFGIVPKSPAAGPARSTGETAGAVAPSIVAVECAG